MDISIRKGTADDASQAAPLILSAAYDILNTLFGAGDAPTTLAFLHQAWRLEQGQYGCNHHWVAASNNRVVGVVTAWHTELGAAFDGATLDSITHVFSVDEAVNVLRRNQALAAELTPPTPPQFMLGHVAVAAHCQRRGVGSMLMEHMRIQAKAHNKQTIVLDVERANAPAIAFYQRLSFHQEAISGKFVRFVKPV